MAIQAACAFATGLQPKDCLSHIGAKAWDFVSIKPGSGFFKRVVYTQFALQNVSPFILNHFAPIKKIVDAAPLINLLTHGALVASFFLNRKEDVGGFSSLPGSKMIAAALATIQVSGYMAGLIPYSSRYDGSRYGIVRSILGQSFAEELKKEREFTAFFKEVVFNLSYPLSPLDRLDSISRLALSHLLTDIIEELSLREVMPAALNYIAEKWGIDSDHKLVKLSKIVFISLLYVPFHATSCKNNRTIAKTFAFNLMVGCLKETGESLKTAIALHSLNNMVHENPFIGPFISQCIERFLAVLIKRFFFVPIEHLHQFPKYLEDPGTIEDFYSFLPYVENPDDK